VVFSRFGVMFFGDPVAAFRNLRRASRRGARLVFVRWQEVRKNPWLLVPLLAVLPHLPEVEMPDPDGAGLFALAKPQKVQRILEAAGYESIALHAVRDFF